MTVPLKLRDSAAPTELQVFTSTEENYLAYQAGLQLSTGSDVADLYLTDTGTNYIIGSFTDTAYDQAVGTGGNNVALTTTTTTTNVRQRQGTASTSGSDFRIPVKQVIQSNQLKILEMNSSDRDTLVDRLISRIFTSDYPGSYKLATSAPSGDYTEYLSNVMTDTRTDGTSIQYNIYRRNAMTAPTKVLPFSIKRSSGATGTYQGLQLMSDAQVKYSLGQLAKNRIASSQTGVGNYRIFSSAEGNPAANGLSGTWVSKGTATDTRQQIVDANYTRTRSSNYNRTRTSTYTRTSTRTRSSNYSQAYTRTRSSAYTRTRSSNYAGNFIGDFLGDYTRTSTRTRTSTYTRTSTRTRVSNYTGTVSYLGDFIGNFIGDFIGNYSRTFVGNYSRTFVGNYSRTFVGNYSRIIEDNYARNFTRNFTGDFLGGISASNAYSRTSGAEYYWVVVEYQVLQGDGFTVDSTYSVFYFLNGTGRLLFSGGQNTTSGTGINSDGSSHSISRGSLQSTETSGDPFIDGSATVSRYYRITASGTFDYTRNFSQSYARNFTGGSRTSTYTRNRTSTYTRNRIASYTRNSLRDSLRTSTRISTREVNYSRNFAGDFLGNYARNFAGDFLGNYQRIRTQDFTRNFARNFVGDYSRNFAGNYVGDYSRNFAGDYLGNYARNFAGNYSRNFVGNYAGDTIGAGNTNIETYTLYVRTA